MNFSSFFMTVLAAACAAGCVSRGSTARKLGDDVYEVRAWDGYGCRKDSDNKTCFSLLMPVIKDLARQKCDDAVEQIPLCTRYEAMSADRIVCKVHCREEDEGAEEGEEEEEAAPAAQDEGRNPSS